VRKTITTIVLAVVLGITGIGSTLLASAANESVQARRVSCTPGYMPCIPNRASDVDYVVRLVAISRLLEGEALDFERRLTIYGQLGSDGDRDSGDITMSTCHRLILGSAVRLPQHPDEHRPERPVLLAVDWHPANLPVSSGQEILAAIPQVRPA
jgi:hypothetical protein